MSWGVATSSFRRVDLLQQALFEAHLGRARLTRGDGAELLHDLLDVPVAEHPVLGRRLQREQPVRARVAVETVQGLDVRHRGVCG